MQYNPIGGFFINLLLFVLIKTSTNLWQFYLVEQKKAKQEAT
jgi:hypothetical protein